MLSQKIDEIVKLSKISPVIVCGLSCKIFDGAVTIEASIPSSKLGIVNTKNGMKFPDWYLELKNNNKNLLIINLIDTISDEEQEKFFELLKYKEITNTALPKNTKIIVMAKDIKNVSSSIKRLCVIY